MKKKMNKIFFLGVIGFTAFSVNAQANILIHEGLEGGSGDVQNVLFDDLNSIASVTVLGSLNQARDIVAFTGTELPATPSAGQAGIVVRNGSFTGLFFRREDSSLGFDKININSVTFKSTDELPARSDFAQVRLNPVPVAGVVPEPATMVLLGVGMVGLGFFGSRLQKHSSSKPQRPG